MINKLRKHNTNKNKQVFQKNDWKRIIVQIRFCVKIVARLKYVRFAIPLQIVPNKKRDFRNVFWLIVDIQINASTVFTIKKLFPNDQMN